MTEAHVHEDFDLLAKSDPEVADPGVLDDQIHVEIAALLRPDQRQRYHEWLARQRDESHNERVLIIPH